MLRLPDRAFYYIIMEQHHLNEEGSRPVIYDGVAIKIYADMDPSRILVRFTDGITAYNMIKKARIAGKGQMNNEISAMLAGHLERGGVRTPFIRMVSADSQLCTKTDIIPIEMIVRNVIAGSMARRLGIEEGIRPENTIYDLCYKSNDLGDPLINDHHAVALGLVTYAELREMYSMTEKINSILLPLFKGIGIDLVDFKVEFGRLPDGSLMLADHITPDNARFWDIRTGERLDKDRFRRDMGKVGDAYREIYSRLLAVSPFFEKGLHEECGVFAVYGVPDAANLTYYGLHALQHRGQEGCGIVSANDAGVLKRVKGEGLVTEVFNEDKLSGLRGNMAIGHVRYSTTGGGGIENVQPFLFRHNTGDFALAHNGNLVNSAPLRKYLENRGSLFQSTSDSEILAHLIKKDSVNKPRIFAIVEALNMIEGAFAFIIMTSNRIYACRDKYGLRPLSIGRLGDGYVLSSETCAFDVIGAEFVRDVEPGEIITIDSHGIRSRRYSEYRRNAMCAMEYVYFARPDSDIEGRNVHSFRKESGRLLFEEAPADADIVVGVPDSSLSAAMGYSEASGLPYEMGLIKNKYIGRTFIQPSQSMREKGVRMKLSAVKTIVKGKRVVLIDDSIVRGTTSRRIVTMLREAGASEVHLRIASPPIKMPCFYGVDISTYDELLCARRSVEEACRAIGADSLAFLSEEALYKAGRRSDLCLACFNGNYPTDLYQAVEEANKDGKF